MIRALETAEKIFRVQESVQSLLLSRTNESNPLQGDFVVATCCNLDLYFLNHQENVEEQESCHR